MLTIEDEIGKLETLIRNEREPKRGKAKMEFTVNDIREARLNVYREWQADRQRLEGEITVEKAYVKLVEKRLAEKDKEIERLQKSTLTAADVEDIENELKRAYSDGRENFMKLQIYRVLEALGKKEGT